MELVELLILLYLGVGFLQEYHPCHSPSCYYQQRIMSLIRDDGSPGRA